MEIGFIYRKYGLYGIQYSLKKINSTFKFLHFIEKDKVIKLIIYLKYIDFIKFYVKQFHFSTFLFN